MQEISPTAKLDFSSINRAKKVYQFFFIELIGIIILVFLEPTFQRVIEGVWARFRLIFVWTLSLDVHAVIAYLFLILFMVQLFWGYQQTKNSGLKQYHARLGYFLMYVIIPFFILAGAWAVLDRATTIPSEESVMFRSNVTLTVIGMIHILVFLAWYTIRSFTALKQNDILMHIDSVLGIFMMASIVAVIRFMHFVFQILPEGSPFTVAGLFFITMPFILGQLALAYYLTGRLRQNRVPLLAQTFVVIIFAIVGDYTMLLS